MGVGPIDRGNCDRAFNGELSTKFD